MITQSQLKEILHYDPETGQFTWRVATRGRIKAGGIAGSNNGSGYIRITVDNNQYFAHRLAWFWMTGSWPIGNIDHRDRDRANNAWGNLREATQSQNMANTTTQRTNSLGLKGVYLVSPGRYRAQIRVQGKNHNLGRFDTPEEAHAAYVTAAKKYHGEFARAA